MQNVFCTPPGQAYPASAMPVIVYYVNSLNNFVLHAHGFPAGPEANSNTDDLRLLQAGVYCCAAINDLLSYFAIGRKIG
jgi:hypothetical protein